MIRQKSGKKMRFMSGLLATLMLTTTIMFADGFTKPVQAFGEGVDNKVFAMKEQLMCSWGAVSVDKGNIIPGKDKTDQKIYFGINPESKRPQEWWIAGRTLTNGEFSSDPANSSHMAIYPAGSITKAKFDEEEANKALKTFSGASFLKKGDKKLLRESEVETLGNKVGEIEKSSDNFYLPSGNAQLGIVSLSKSDISAAKKLDDIVDKRTLIPHNYWIKGNKGEESIFWLRSKSKEIPGYQYAGFGMPEKIVKSIQPMYAFDLAPACKLSVESIIFASAASAFHSINGMDVLGKFVAVDNKSGHYGMYLKSSPVGTDLTDSTIRIDEKNSSKILYGNVPKDVYLSVCMTEENNKESSYVMSVPLNESGNTSSGEIDIKNLDTSNIGENKKFNVIVWLEKKDKNGLVVATMPKSTIMTTAKSLEVKDIASVVFDNSEKKVDAMSVKFGEKVLVSGADYEAKYYDNKEIGTAKVVIKGLKEYSGKMIVKDFKILKPTPVLNLKDKTAVFNGKAIMIDEAAVSGLGPEKHTKSNIIYKYYKDKECKSKICSYCPVIAKEKIPKTMPEQLGEYYVRATIHECKKYNAAVSNIAKLIIK